MLTWRPFEQSAALGLLEQQQRLGPQRDTTQNVKLAPKEIGALESRKSTARTF